MNILGGIGAGIAGFMSGGPVGGVLGLASGLGTSATTGAVNSANNTNDQSTAKFMAFEQSLQDQQLYMKATTDYRGAMFNEALDNRSETMRETNELRDLSMEQRKADIQITKEFIKSIE